MVSVSEEPGLCGVKTNSWLTLSGKESWRRGNPELRLLCSESSFGAKASLLWGQMQMARMN